MSYRDKKILLVVLGVLVAALVYFFPVSDLIKEKEKIASENLNLNAKVIELQQMVSKEGDLKEETRLNNEKSDAIVMKFPSEIRTENEVMDMIKLEDETKVNVVSISVVDPIPVNMPGITEDALTETIVDRGVETSISPEGEGSGEAVSTVDSVYTLYDMPVTVLYKGGYNGLKSFVNTIANANKKGITNVSATYDPGTGFVNGTVVYDSFYLYGSSRPYEEIRTDIQHGTDNIFGTLEVKNRNRDRSE